MVNSSSKVLEAFIEGSLIRLRLPNIDADVLNGEWHTWFNNRKVTQYLEHGVFPVSRDQQLSYVTQELQDKNSLLLAIDSLESDRHVGVISIKSINFLQRKAEIAIVMSPSAEPGMALEAMALMTQHAFDRLNLQKLYAGQHEGLWKWVNSLALIGYKVEGFRENWGIREGRSWGAIITAVESDYFYALRKSRGGDILCGNSLLLQRKRSKINFVAELKDSLSQINKKIIDQELTT
jgi:hypothetical protein